MSGLAWWLWWLVGGPIILIGVWLVRRALARDPDAGRRRCPSCWYVMEGVPGLRCPECGLEAENEPSLHRTRRSRPLAIAGLLIIAAGYAVGRGHAVTTSWRGLVPTTALLWTEPLHPWDHLSLDEPNQSPTPWGDELLTRFQEGSLWEWQQHWLLDRDVDQAIQMPRAWMVGDPLEMRVVSTWMTSGNAARILHVDFDDPVLPAVDVSIPSVKTGMITIPPQNGRVPLKLGGLPRTLGSLPLGVHDLSLSLTLIEGSAPNATIVWKGQVSRTVHVVADPLETVAADDSAATSEIVRKLLRLSTDNAARFWWEWWGLNRRNFQKPFPDVTIAADVEFLYDGEVKWTVPMIGRVLGRLKSGRTPWDFLSVEAATEMDPKWMIRIRSAPMRALQDFGVERVWVGEVLIPAGEICPKPLGRPVPVRICP